MAKAVALPASEGAELPPVRYVEGLAAAVERAGGRIHERTRVLGAGKLGPPRLTTDHATVSAAKVVLATHMPLLDRGLWFTRLTTMRSYALGSPVPEPLGGMLISADGPTRSLRSHPHGAGELLIVGGEGHVTGEEPDTTARYHALEDFARERFGVDAFPYRWSAHDLCPPTACPTPASFCRAWTGSGLPPGTASGG